ncbi:MMPL family transporter [Nocardia pseudobrasiliensis]|uniref:RND superfamily putative drug exporter n=1 Tax=Nocardia pseudobrasiliensis TaxID=45979 RepID=A0A370HP54_9NOCA|nr:MMPL family transporter [Nocardia pseudobrasiliensis]RDI60356.1 RND superfamily putative drug exporter [Nocardia pseudobrasiliensis]
MLTTLARLTTARPRVVLAASLLLMLLCGLFGKDLQSDLKIGGFAPPATESAARTVHDGFPGASPNLVITVESPAGVDSPAAVAAARGVLDRLRERTDVRSVQSFLDPGAAALRGRSGTDGLILADLAGEDTVSMKAAGEIQRAVSTTSGAVTVRVGGFAGETYDTNTGAAKDLALAEGVALPLTFLVLILVFGSLVAAALPLVIGLFSIVTTLGILEAVTKFTDVSIFALNMTTVLGLALAIDYSLLMVSRYREEIDAGLDHRAATIRTVRTAGRTVLFSAATVALGLGALVIFPAYFLRSFAYAGLPVVATAAFAAVAILPACLILLGDKVNALDLREPLRRLLRRGPVRPVAPAESGWYRWAAGVMTRPIAVTVGTVAALLLLGSPFLSVTLAYPDYRAMSESSQSRQVGDIVHREFDLDLGSGVAVALPDYHGPVAGYAAALSGVGGVANVESADGVFRGGQRIADARPGMSTDAGTYLAVHTTVDPYAKAGADQLTALRAVPAPGSTVFAGNAVLNKDGFDALYARLPLVLAIVALTSFVLLFLFTGSVVLPLKALVLNLLSLSASFGATVWIFQQGHLAGLFGFTPTGMLSAAGMPVLMFCLAFGLSMDYEVFLLARIREQWLDSDRGPAANTHAVAMGLARTGRIFTAAAGLMAIIFLAVTTSHASFMQMFGLGLALAVLSDATVIRSLLVPAAMRLMGTANWWCPGPLAALHRRIGLSEAESAASDPIPTRG